jgi:hypothetical protein
MAIADTAQGTQEFGLSRASETFLFNLSVKTANGLTSKGGTITSLILGILLILYSVLDIYRGSRATHSFTFSVEIFSIFFSGLFFIILSILSWGSPRRRIHG